MNNNLKVNVAKALARTSLKIGKISMNSSCAYIFHQPKVPENIKQILKKK